MREYTEQERLELGIEIVAATKQVPLPHNEIVELNTVVADCDIYVRAHFISVADAALKWMAEREQPYTKQFEDEIFAAADANSDLGWSKDGYTVDLSKVRHTFESVANTAYVNGAKWMYRRLTGNESI